MHRNTILRGTLAAVCCATVFLTACGSLWRYSEDATLERPKRTMTITVGGKPAIRAETTGIPKVGRLIHRHMSRAPLETGCRLGAVSPVCLRSSPHANAVARPRLAQRGHRKKEPWQEIGLNEELWVIAKAEPTAEPTDDAGPTQGELRAKMDDREIPLPLKHTDVRARISAFISSVDVVQQYENPYDTKIEAVYVFPLPQSSAITDFVMTIGDRKIRGMVREREEATRIYEAAKAQGYRAALLTQERPNIFTQKVANIEPGKAIDITIRYFNPLPYRDGEYEFVFPMVVGPRFNPPGATDGVGAVARGQGGASGQKTEIEYLKPGERSGHDIAVTVDIDAGMQIEKAYSHTHAIDVHRKDPARMRITLKRTDRIPNRDFVLRYRVAGNTLKTALLMHEGKKGKTFALVLQPPADIQDTPRMPCEMVFVLDCSGSMSGAPINTAKRAMKRCLRNLGSNDTFQIIRFSQSASSWGAKPVPATRENIAKALSYVDELQGSGGTMMIEGIKAALDFPHEEGRLRIVSFMTDGKIGNEAHILTAIRERLGASRIFSFGVGNSVNRYLLERMASFGKGAVAFVGLDDSAAAKVDRFYDRIARPALTDIAIDWGEMQVRDVYPRVIPDIFVGRPVMVTGRFEGDGPTRITVRGRAGDREQTYIVPVDPTDAATAHAAITSIWARWKIKDLSEAEIVSPAQELKDEIVAISVEYSLLSRYTAFLAVDSLARTTGAHGVSVHVPVPVPDGVRYETTVQER